MVLVTTLMGYLLAGGSPDRTLCFTLIGTLFSCAGAAALNAYLERNYDKNMERTCGRPLPLGLLAPEHALSYGLLMVVLGVTILVYSVNLLCGFLALLTAFLYVMVYTPLKRITWLNTLIGAIPGAIPPVGGWVAVSGELTAGAWILFAIMFLWQHPHFFAIAWLYKDDYAQGGYKMLPALETDGSRTAFQMILFGILLLVAATVPYFTGMLGRQYLFGAFAISLVMLFTCLVFWKARTNENAMRVLKTSLVYLPVLLLFIAID
jgi:protoheme IX farnesyltransferase